MGTRPISALLGSRARPASLCSRPAHGPALSIVSATACAPGSFSAANASICQTCPSYSTSGSGAASCECNAGYSTAGFGTSLVCTGTSSCAGPVRAAPRRNGLTSGVVMRTPSFVGRLHCGLVRQRWSTVLHWFVFAPCGPGFEPSRESS